MLLYIHVPFCRQKCAYCAFYSIPLSKPPLMATDKLPPLSYTLAPDMISGRTPNAPSSSPCQEGDFQHAGYALLDNYCQTLITEIASRAPTATAPVSSIFFGGGTPSLLSGHQIERILNTIQRHYTLEADMEITMEANPESALRPHWLHEARQAGVNRLSLGIQSFTDSDLALLGRCHNAGQAREALRLAHEAQFCSISLDLMWALPWFTNAPRPVSPVAHWLATLKAALEWSPHHISAYGLILEDGTPLATMAGLDKWTKSTESAEPAELAELAKRGEANSFRQTTPKAPRAEPVSAGGALSKNGFKEQHRQEQQYGQELGGGQWDQRDDKPNRNAGGQRLAFPSEEEETTMYIQGIELLARYGFAQYEISNFALHGHQCRHNIGYWQGKDYLGFGPSAVSTLGTTRLSNVDDVEDWARGIASGRPRYAREELLPHALREEKIMLSLRMAQGLALADWNRISHHPLPDMPLARRLVQDGLATFHHGQDGGRFALTPSGMLVSNAIISRLFESVPE